MAAGNLTAAVEHFDQGVGEDPGNSQMRELGVLARQLYTHALRQDIDRLVRSGRFMLAMGRLVELEEMSRRAEQVSMPGDLPADLERERAEVTQKATKQLGQAMETRGGRSIAVKADLAACRQLLALVENDEAVKRTCDRLRSRFLLLAVLEEAPDTAPVTRKLFVGIEQQMKEKNPELIEIVDKASGRHTALMELWVGEHVVREIPLRMTQRRAFHRWIPKKDRRGRQVFDERVIHPTAKQVADAKKRGLPPPKPKKVRKQVWEEISGEFRVFAAERSATMAYRVTIQDLRSKTVAVEFSGVVHAASESKYYEYSGDPRGEDRPPVRCCKGRGCAPALLSGSELAIRALAQIPGRVVNTTLERVE
jgi:hypothetical protein